jgi:hypothetical protein
MRSFWRPSPFDNFCEKYLDGLYCSKLSIDSQCSGYYKLKEMVILGIEPASEEEFKRWKNNPTREELFSPPHIKYLTFLHELTRNPVRRYWNYIKKLRLE